MDNLTTYQFFDTFNEDKLSFSYMGALSNQMVVSSINLIERNISDDNNLKKLRHKLSFLMIESFQNIIRYGDEPANKKLSYRREMFTVRNIGGMFYIGSVNLIENQKVNYVGAKLTEVNQLDGSALNNLYRKILTNNKFTDAGGAGLGFIEMARKTNQKLQYDFVKINEEYSYFYLLIVFKCKTSSNKTFSKFDIEWLKEFHDKACRDNIIVMHKGNFSPEVIDPVINMVSNNIKSKGVNIQKLAFHIIIEALQNLSNHSIKHNNEKEAIFIIRNNEGHHIISTGNFIKQTNIEKLKRQLDNLKKMTRIDLKRLCDETTHSKSNEKKQDIGLGLIEIAIESNNKFDYHFHPINNKFSFYTFNVAI